jgi:hypothetical protein
MNPDFSIVGENANFEPHYNLINDPNRTQIYELVTGDVNGQFTNVLERAFVGLKDNRLTPQGFSLSDPVYDTTQIIGGALTDPDFNRFLDGSEGSGADVIHYALPNNGYTGYLTVTAKIWYQSLPPKWMAPIFEWSAPEIDSFKNMLQNADLSPILIATRVLDSVYVTPVSAKEQTFIAGINIYPTLNQDGWLYIENTGNTPVREVSVWDAAGNICYKGKYGAPIRLPEKRGVYFVAVETRQGRMVQKVLRP